MREVATVVKAHAQHRVARVQQRQVHGHVGVGARVRLHVGVIGAEERAHPVACDVLDVVHHRVAAVVALVGVALRVLVGQHRAGGGHDRRRGEVLRGDQLQPPLLALQFGIQQVVDLGIRALGPSHVGVLLVDLRGGLDR